MSPASSMSASIVLALLLVGCSPGKTESNDNTQPVTVSEAESTAIDPRAIHESLLTMDTHLDTPALLVQAGFDIANRHDPLHDLFPG